MAKGLMPGWQRVPGWSPSNKVYTSLGEYVEREPLKIVSEEERHTYEVKFDKTINLFISPGDVIEITRILEDNYYKEVRAIPYIGGLDAWIENILIDLCRTNWDRTNFEVGGGFVQPSYGAVEDGLKGCETNITFKKYTPPEEIPIPPEFVLRTIIDLEMRRDVARTKARKEAVQDIIDKLKAEYGIE